MIAALTANLEDTMYSCSSAFGNGLVITARLSKYSLRSSKALSCSGPHWKFLEPFSNLKKGRDFFADREMNSEESLPVNFWTPPLRCWWLHSSYSFDLLEVSFNAPLYDHAHQQLSPPYAKDAFFWVQFEPVLPEVVKSLTKVLNVVFALLAWNDEIINLR